MLLSIPTLHTSRLRLRAFAESDLDNLASMLADPEVTRFLGDGQPKTRPESWRQLAGILGHWVLRGFGLWALELQSSGQWIGWCGHLQPEGWPAFEIGYSLARPFWRQGYAREAAAEALRYAREELKKSEIISLIRPDNAASIRVATFLGATLAESSELMGGPALVYRYRG